MKKQLLTLAAVLCLTWAGMAQEKEQNSFQQDVVQLMKIQSGGQFEVLYKQVEEMIPEHNLEAFKAEMNKELDTLYTQLAKVYMETYTKEDIRKILDFYETPVGKKIIENTPELTEKSMYIGQEWGMKLQPLLVKYSK